MKRYKNILLHVTGGFLFLTLSLILTQRPPGMPLFSPPAIRDLLVNLLMLLTFYLNYYIFIPEIYFREKYFIYSLVLIIGLLYICLLPPMLTGYLHIGPPPGHGGPGGIPGNNPPLEMSQGQTLLQIIKHSIYLYIAVILFSLLLRIRTRLYETELLKNNAEISSLKNKINPHFLFNTLNNLYALAIRENSKSTASGIIKLSGMMRYVVTETNEKLVPLEREITYINHYIDLQKLRLTQNLDLVYHVNGDAEDLEIAPLILIPFIENAFKHGVNPDQEASIHISIDIDKDSIILKVENRKVTVGPGKHTKSGVGIENAKMRLNLLYRSKHKLSISDTADRYIIELTMQLK